MAGTATAKSKNKDKIKVQAREDSLENVYAEVEKLLKRHAPPFRTDVGCNTGEKRAFQLTVPKPVLVPGAYGGKPVDVMLAAVILQKGYVGFYLMCDSMNDAMKKKLSPGLLRLLKGKTCFHLKKMDDELRKDIELALELGAEAYEERGWL